MSATAFSSGFCDTRQHRGVREEEVAWEEVGLRERAKETSVSTYVYTIEQRQATAQKKPAKLPQSLE